MPSGVGVNRTGCRPMTPNQDEPWRCQRKAWPEYQYRDTRKGQNAIFVIDSNPYPLETGWLWKWLRGKPVGYANIPGPASLPPRIADEFDSVTDLGEFEIKIGNRIFRRLHLWACYHLK